MHSVSNQYGRCCHVKYFNVGQGYHHTRTGRRANRGVDRALVPATLAVTAWEGIGGRRKGRLLHHNALHSVQRQADDEYKGHQQNAKTAEKGSKHDLIV